MRLLDGPRKIKARLFSGRQSKGENEYAYWRHRKRLEGTLGNSHYESFYTEQFGLTRSDYAGKRVLDIGCGPRGSLEWADEALERVGLDPLVPQYRALGIDAHGMTYVESGAEHIPFPDGHFDIVAAFNSLDHVGDVDAAVKEMTRVTKPGGIGLVIVEANHAPTPTEPHTLGWDFLDSCAGWEVVEQRRVAMDEHDLYDAWRRGEPWVSGPGLIGGRLLRLQG
jgi:SAM-dependent methyltransferase